MLISVRKNRLCVIAFNLIILLQVIPSAYGKESSMYYCSMLMMNENCDCYPILASYEVLCPSVQPKFLMRIKPEEYIQIECNRMENYDMIPSMVSIDTVTSMSIRYCPMLLNYTIKETFESIGIDKLQKLSIEWDDTVANITSNYFQGLVHLRDLQIKVSGSTLIPQELLSYKEFRTLHNLIINGNQRGLPEGLFQNLDHLHSLTLTSFKFVPGRIFYNLYNLKELRLINNRLERITNQLFRDNKNLNHIDFRNNQIKVIENGSFKFLSELKQITLKGNHLRNLPDNLFQYNRDLREFSLSHCGPLGIKTLPHNLLADLFKLKRIQISCNIAVLSGNLFANSTSLNYINLAFNKFETLPSFLFRTQYNLVDLNLSYNSLTQLPDDIFSSNIKLMKLILSHNHLETLSSRLFSTLTELEHLDISNNNLLLIATNDFQNNRNLKSLYLNNNQLTFQYSNLQRSLEKKNVVEKMSSPFVALERLERLDLSHNFIKYIYDDWRLQLPKLKELNLSFNNLTSIDINRFQMDRDHHLRINLQHNKGLKRLNYKRRVEELRNLSKNNLIVDLNHNSIICDCKLVDFVKAIHHLKDDELALQVNLETLRCLGPKNLKGELIKNVNPEVLLCPLEGPNAEFKVCPIKCDCSVRSYDLTLIVNCTEANLTTVPELPAVRSLHLNQTELHLDYNYINILPKVDAFTGFNDVVKLSLYHNSLTGIDNENLPENLRYLDLRENRLTHLNVSMFDRWDNFDEENVPIVYLSQNSWKCDCKSKVFLQMIQQNYRLIRDLDTMTCTESNGSANETYFSELSIMELCHDEYEYICIIIVCLIVLLIISIMMGFYYKFNKELKIWLYAHGLCLRFISEEELDKHKLYDAFISYSHKDEEFIANYLVPQLEGGTTPYKLCVHVRDFEVGHCIPEQIVNAIDNSRRTIIVLSKNFIKSQWSRLEFREAHRAALDEGRTRIIVILYNDLKDMDMDMDRNLDNELKAYLKMNTYLKWGDPWFWQKLQYAMPHRSKMNSSSNRLSV